MSGKSDKRMRRQFRKLYKADYLEFLNNVYELSFSDRLRIAWTVIKGKNKNANTKN